MVIALGVLAGFVAALFGAMLYMARNLGRFEERAKNFPIVEERVRNLEGMVRNLPTSEEVKAIVEERVKDLPTREEIRSIVHEVLSGSKKNLLNKRNSTYKDEGKLLSAASGAIMLSSLLMMPASAQAEVKGLDEIAFWAFVTIGVTVVVSIIIASVFHFLALREVRKTGSETIRSLGEDIKIASEEIQKRIVETGEQLQKRIAENGEETRKRIIENGEETRKRIAENGEETRKAILELARSHRNKYKDKTEDR